jgi:ubiquinone/menaquinone biosynthesis C-methylase UbiE
MRGDTVPEANATSNYPRRYLTLPRIITHWHQANEVARTAPQGGDVLEVGPGSGHTTWVLRNWGYKVTTVDYLATVRPDVVADVTKLPLADQCTDCALAAEVLEHLPFDQFIPALRELRRVSRQSVVVTLPAPFLGVSALWNWPKFEPKGIFMGVPYAVKHRWNGEHYWEVGKRGYSVGRITRCISESGLKLVRSFRPAPSLYCYFFVLAT